MVPFRNWPALGVVAVLSIVLTDSPRRESTAEVVSVPVRVVSVTETPGPGAALKLPVGILDPTPAEAAKFTVKIDYEKRYDGGSRIVATATATGPESASYGFAWRGRGVTVNSVKVKRDGKVATNVSRAYFWGTDGENKGFVVAVSQFVPGQTEAIAPKIFERTFTIGPEPPPAPLNQLVDAATAAKLAEALRFVATGVDAAKPDDPADFIDNAFVAWFESKQLTDNKAWPIILDRVTAAAPVGKSLDVPAVVAVLNKIADELSAAPGPTPPPGPTPGPVVNKAEKLWIVYLSKAGAATVNQNAMLDAMLGTNLAPHKWIHYYTDGADGQRYAKYATDLPCAVVMDQAVSADNKSRVLGVEVTPGDCPADWLPRVAAKYAKDSKTP